MYLSLEDKLIFFHVPKNAGTSIVDLLVRKFGKNNMISNSLDISHLTPKHLVMLYSMDLANFDLFMTSRNPYDSEISYYLYMVKNKKHRLHRNIVKMDFNEYLMWRVKNPGVSQSDYYWEGMHVFQMEKMEMLYEHFSFSSGGIKNSSGVRNRKYYTEKSAEIIYKLRRGDFDQFGYSQESWSHY